VAARRIGAIRREKAEWLWPGWLARGVLTLIDGDPGTGKSTLAAELAARVSQGQRLAVPQGNVLLLTSWDLGLRKLEAR
jgi:predicted ATP-dependent serine protease